MDGRAREGEGALRVRTDFTPRSWGIGVEAHAGPIAQQPCCLQIDFLFGPFVLGFAFEGRGHRWKKFATADYSLDGSDSNCEQTWRHCKNCDRMELLQERLWRAGE